MDIGVLFSIFVLSVVSLLCSRAVSEARAVECGPGQRLVVGRVDGRDTCEMCSQGKFQDKQSHREEFCIICSRFDIFSSMRKILVDDCTRFHDVIFRCREGLYLNEHRECYVCPKPKVVKDGKCAAPTDFHEPTESSMLKQKDTCHDNGTYDQAKGDNASSNEGDGTMSNGKLALMLIAVPIIVVN